MLRKSDHKPSAKTLADIVIARARSRLAVSDITEEYSLALLSIFRTEIGGYVTRVSAFLLALLQAEKYDLDSLTWAIQPGRGWPFRNLAPARDFPTTIPRSASERWRGRKRDVVLRNGSSPIFPLRDAGRARMRVIDDCLDVTATIGGHSFVSTGGHLRVTVPWAVPKSVIAACIDQPLSNVIDLALCSYRDWPIFSVERMSTSPGCTFVANVGTRPYVLPWVDRGG